MTSQLDTERKKWTTPHPDERARRIFDFDRASQLMTDAGIDIILPNTEPNIRYVADYYYAEGAPDFMMEDGESYYDAYVGVPRDDSKTAFFVGCTGEEGYISWKDPWVSDRRFWGPQFPVVDGGWEQNLKSNPVDVVIEVLVEKGLEAGNIGLEMRHIKHAHFEQLRQHLPKATFTDAEPLLWEMRVIKSPEEISRLRMASRGVSKAAEKAFRTAHVGMTELDMARVIKKTLIDEGCSPLYTLVAFGPKGAYLIDPTPNRLKEGQIMRYDITATYRGYVSDISRVAAFGKVSDRVEWAHGVLLTANQAMREATKPGMKGFELRKLEMDIMVKEGMEPLIPMAGHGVGRMIHEPPFMTKFDNTLLEQGMTLAIEPTIRMQGVGSVNIEDTVVVTEDGIESLTTAPRGLYDYV